MRRSLLAAAALLAALVAAAPAAAHGDPASEQLAKNDLYFPFRVTIPADAQDRLTATMAEAARKGFSIRVALIGSAYDLGLDGSAWRKPQAAAQAIDSDIAYYYPGRLLVVMPNGFGFLYPKHDVTHERQLLARIRVGDLADSATTAVRRLAAQAGVHVSTPQQLQTAADRNRHDRYAILIAGGVLLGGGWLLMRRRMAARIER